MYKLQIFNMQRKFLSSGMIESSNIDRVKKAIVEKGWEFCSFKIDGDKVTVFVNNEKQQEK